MKVKVTKGTVRFTPLTISITTENFNELLDLYHRIKTSQYVIAEAARKSNSNVPYRVSGDAAARISIESPLYLELDRLVRDILEN